MTPTRSTWAYLAGAVYALRCLAYALTHPHRKAH